MFKKFVKGMFVGLLMVCAVLFVSGTVTIQDTTSTFNFLRVDYDLNITDDLFVGDDATIYGTLTKPQDTAIKMYSNTSDAIGEPMPLEFYGVVPEAKPFLQWRTWYFDNNISSMVYGYTAWMGAHYNSSLLGDRHQHFAIETLDLNTSSVNTRFAIDYGRFLENMTAYFNAINYLELRTGVDLRFKTGIIKHENELDIYPENQEVLGLRVDLSDTEGNVSISALGSDYLILNDEVKIETIRDGTGSVVCVQRDGNLGTCADAPDASGDCNCG